MLNQKLLNVFNTLVVNTITETDNTWDIKDDNRGDRLDDNIDGFVLSQIYTKFVTK